MTYVVCFEDDTTTLVDGADAYEQEGPLTTFFARNGGGRITSAFSERVASFRTSRIVEVRRVAATEWESLGADCAPQSSARSASSTTTSHRWEQSPHR